MSQENRATHSAVAGAQQTEVAVLAGGCFWGVEEILRDVPGVIDTDVGYTGGWLKNPTYDDTHDSKSGHAEAIRVTFDPSVLSYEDLLEKWFFRLHDPTTLNRQGNDIGTQYRSAIFPQTPGAEGDRGAGEGAGRRVGQVEAADHDDHRAGLAPGTAPRATTRTICGSIRADTAATTCGTSADGGNGNNQADPHPQRPCGSCLCRNRNDRWVPEHRVTAGRDRGRLQRHSAGALEPDLPQKTAFT